MLLGLLLALVTRITVVTVPFALLQLVLDELLLLLLLFVFLLLRRSGGELRLFDLGEAY